MAFTKPDTYQLEGVISVRLTFADITAAGGVAVIPMVPGGRVTGGHIHVLTANDDTAAALTVDLGDAGSGTRYASNVNIKSAASTALTVSGYKHVEGEDLVLNVDQAPNGDATAGEILIDVKFVAEDRANEVAA